MSNFKIYLKSILIPVIVGTIVGFITSGFMDYGSLVQPPLAPPAILFPIPVLSHCILSAIAIVDVDFSLLNR